MKYFARTPWWMKKFFAAYTWDIKTKEKVLYLTFDDGPHEQATPFVLNELKRYNARATFFCVGKNVTVLPALYQRILDDGHTTGNHTYNHLNGWKTADSEYLNDIAEAAKYINSPLFRPPYGRIRSSQAKSLKWVLKDRAARIIMWDVLSGDFDNDITKEKCLQNVTSNVRAGSIVVFHDSTKAFASLQYCLPRTLEYFAAKGFRFEALTGNLFHNRSKQPNIAAE